MRRTPLVGLAALVLSVALPAEAQVLSSDRVDASAPGRTEWTTARDLGPRLRVVSEDAASVTVEVTATWPTPLADVVARADGSAFALATLGSGGMPVLSHEIALSSRVPPGVEVLAVDVERAALPAGLTADAAAELAGPLAEVVNVGTRRREMVGSLALRVLRVEGGQAERVRRLVVRVPRPLVMAALAARGAANPHVAVTRSALAEGRWFRIPVAREGVLRIDRAYLTAIGAPDADLARVQVFGNGGRILPALAGAPRLADLNELATLQTPDAVLAFVEGPRWWDWVPPTGQQAEGRWQHGQSPFSHDAHVFLRVDTPAPRRVGPATFPGWADATRLATVTDRFVHHVDRFNQPRDGSGSGLDWMGEDLPRSGGSLTVLDTLPPSTGPARVRARLGTRSNTTPTVTMLAGTTPLASGATSTVNLSGDNTGNLLADRVLDGTRPAGGSLALSFRATGVNGTTSGAWLDWAEVVVERSARASSAGYLRFATPGGQSGRFEVALEGFTREPQVWDVTSPEAIQRLGVRTEGGTYIVQVEAAGRAREIVAFDPEGTAARRPRPATPVATQNLHGIQGFPDYVVVTHEAFLEQAQRLAEYRRTQDGLTPVVVTVDQINNEFASGSGDMRAIRDYAKFLYDRAPAGQLPRYLLLFGDGHYDFRGIDPSVPDASRVPNFVPTYQTENMFSRVNSYTSDDYFGLLDDAEGLWTNTSERVDLGIGRIPVRSAAEASAFVDKLQRYENPASGGTWRTRATFVADDQFPNTWDQDLHVFNADFTSERLRDAEPRLSFEKIYAPSFPSETTARGRRRPAAVDAIIRSLNEGTLIWNYSGHGSPQSLGDEKYFTPEILDQLDNADRPAIFVTATCSFGKYDNPDAQSLAEEVLLRGEGGGIAMFTTVRVVYTSSTPSGTDNFGLNIELSRQMVTRDAAGRPRTLGDILESTKNTAAGASINNRKFNLLGDPAMRIGLPEQAVEVTGPGALVAFEEATVTGRVLGADGQPDLSFTGEVQLDVFDARRVVQMPRTPLPFPVTTNTGGQYEVQTDLVYSGRASVTAGAFAATFRVPQDVSYSGERARVAAYVRTPDGRDGTGIDSMTVVSATAGARPDDARGPDIRLFVGDTTFVSGGLVRSGAPLIARLRDDSGINTVGAGVGHEILLTINGDDAGALDVGRFYTADLDTYRSGTVRVPLPRLAPGSHSARLQAWDAVNNVASAEVAFTISDAEGLEVRSVLPYPNPTAGPTRFTFEHNLPGGTLARAQVRIFTLAGRPVRTLDDALPGGVVTAGVAQIPWDGLDDDGDRLASGVYLYRFRLEVEDATGQTQVAERVERLAIIR